MKVSKIATIGSVQFQSSVSKIGDLTKRILDFAVSLIGLVLLSPLFLLIGLWIKREGPGPIFYYGIRVGRKGKLFLIMKFRTMVENEDAHNGNNITAHDDPRITHFGRFLRDTKLNELPQFVNVLKGEMSLVGPRPEDPSILKHYNEEQRELLSVRPGMTSLASVIYADEEKMLQAENVTDTYLHTILPKKLRLDLLYVRNRSFLLDLDILFRTLFVFIPQFRKATSNAEDIVLGPFRFLRRLISWFTIDAAISFVALSLTGLTWRTVGPLDVGLGVSLLFALFMAFVFTIMNAITGVQRIEWRYASAGEAVGLILSVSISTLLLHMINLLFVVPTYPFEMLLVSGVLALAGFLTVRYRRQMITGVQIRLARFRAFEQVARERVLVVGAGEAGQLTLWLLQNSPSSKAFHIVGVVDDDLNKLGTSVHQVPVLGMCDRIPQIVKEHDIGMILFAIHSIDWERRNEILESCWRTSARTVVAPDILTFMRKGTDPHDRRTWLPKMRQANDQSISQEDIEKVNLQDDIHVMAEMARRGDYAGLSEYLIHLDAYLKDESKEEVESKVELSTAAD